MVSFVKLCRSWVDSDERVEAANDLRHYVRVYDGNLEPELCQQMLRSFAALARFQKANGRTVRAALSESAWTELNISRLADDGFKSFFRAQIDQALVTYNNDVKLGIPIPNTPVLGDLMLKRYRPSQQERFQLHFDAVDHLAHRYLVLLWYLNDVAEGGETRFPQLGLSVSPKAGRLLIFPPYWMYQHEGAAPVSGDKYIVSTYLLFPGGSDKTRAAEG